MLIDKAGIARLIPHAGTMCLIGGVLSHDETRISCATTSHQAMDNPLRRDGRLGVLCGVEYAAQAMALQGALAPEGAGLDAVRARGGYLASLRAVEIHIDRLDLLPGMLIVEAERLHGDADRALYRFALRHEGRVLLSGRAAVSLAGGVA
jgi:predicted hotdog family 3-hydroxylacyl-ACP dehydratase